MATKFPYDDVEKLLAPVVRFACYAAAGAPLPPKWRGATLSVPVHHCVLQPQELLDNLNGGECPKGDKLAHFILLAFQLGVCQGYAIRAEERRELEAAQKLLVDIATLDSKKEQK